LQAILGCFVDNLTAAALQFSDNDLQGLFHAETVDLVMAVSLGAVLIFIGYEVFAAATGSSPLYNNAAFYWQATNLGFVSRNPSPQEKSSLCFFVNR
jgi:hypothetical protein